MSAEDGHGQVKQSEFITILMNIPAVTLTTKDAVVISSSFPHTLDGAVSWQKFLPWAYTTISSLYLEHMIKRRMLLVEIDKSTANTNEQDKHNNNGSRPSTSEGNVALDEMMKLAEQSMELIKVRYVVAEDAETGDKEEQILALFPFDFDEMAKSGVNTSGEEEEEFIASLDTLSLEQGDDGSVTELYSGKQCTISAMIVDPPAKKSHHRISSASQNAVASPEQSKRSKAYAAAQPSADAASMSPVKVNVKVVAVENKRSMDRELAIYVDGEYEYKKKNGTFDKRVSFSVDLDTPIMMPSMCLIDPDAASEFAESIPDKLLLEFTKGGMAAPRLMMKPPMNLN